MTDDKGKEPAHQRAEYRTSIKDWPEGERPREKIMTHGAESLSDTELLAIIIHAGNEKANAIEIARDLLKKYGTLRNIARRSVAELVHQYGIGPARATNIISAFELGRRNSASRTDDTCIVNCPEDVANRYIPLLRDLPTERFLVLLLNNSGAIIREVTISTGTVNASLVHPREVFKAAVVELATGIILLHNHPSGVKQASREDHAITKQLVEAGRMMDIPVNDHIIICGNSYVSFAENGWL
jgi:DNA repair protein RadC